MCLPFLPPTIEPPTLPYVVIGGHRYALSGLPYAHSDGSKVRHRPSWRVPNIDTRAERKARRWWHLSQLREAFLNFFNR